MEELYGIFEGIAVPDKKELRRMFHEKRSKNGKEKKKVAWYHRENLLRR